MSKHFPVSEERAQYLKTVDGICPSAVRTIKPVAGESDFQISPFDLLIFLWKRSGLPDNHFASPIEAEYLKLKEIVGTDTSDIKNLNIELRKSAFEKCQQRYETNPHFFSAYEKILSIIKSSPIPFSFLERKNSLLYFFDSFRDVDGILENKEPNKINIDFRIQEASIRSSVKTPVRAAPLSYEATEFALDQMEILQDFIGSTGLDEAREIGFTTLFAESGNLVVNNYVIYSTNAALLEGISRELGECGVRDRSQEGLKEIANTNITNCIILNDEEIKSLSETLLAEKEMQKIDRSRIREESKRESRKS